MSHWYQLLFNIQGENINYNHCQSKFQGWKELAYCKHLLTLKFGNRTAGGG